MATKRSSGQAHKHNEIKASKHRDGIKARKHRNGIRASKRSQKRKKQRMRKMAMMAAVCVLVLLAGCYLSMRIYVGKVEEKKICNNIFVGEIDVSGMTTKQAKAALEEHFAQDAEIVVTMQAETKSAEATLAELGVAAKDVDALVKEAMNYGKKGGTWKCYRQLKALEKEAYVISEQFELDEVVAESVLEERIATLEDGAVNATIEKTSSGFDITEGKEGKVVNIEKSLAFILDQVNGKWDHKPFSVEMVLETGQPEIMAADLEEIQDVLGEYSTDAGGGDRWQNLKAGSDILNGTILMPGEELSVYNTTAPYDEEHGYVQAGTYENGEIVADWGGGICQVSSTLYNAVIYAELEIVERYPHSMTVSYVDPSRDAAIAGGIMDFRFKNSYDTPIYIFSEIDADNQLRFIIYGKETRPENRTIEFESETVSTDEYKVVYQENASLGLGEMEYTGNPHTGRDAQLWKIVYEDGEEVSREVFNTSYYMRVDEVIEVGTAGASGSALSALQSAIASQDYNQIISAINAAY